MILVYTFIAMLLCVFFFMVVGDLSGRIKTEDRESNKIVMAVVIVFMLVLGVISGFISIGWLIETSQRIYDAVVAL